MHIAQGLILSFYNYLKEKFELLAMAFKSDSETMTNRLTVHLRNRTTTEHNARKSTVLN